MKAVTYQGIKNIQVKEVADPKIEKADDIVIKLTTTAICGSDLHLIHGMVPNMPTDYIIGHEPMGIVEEVGPEVTKVKKGDRVIIPFNVSRGECFYCKNQLESQCDNSNPHGEMGGYFGYSETAGGYAGGQAEYMRVPYANFVPFKVPENCEVADEKLCLIADAMPTAYWSVDNAGLKAETR
ncbi:alcohol dehydrogenase catalytic domain-containing protein [Paenibacillus sp. P26]|nr:alcohol dehydrogenase catalytic domain-containing protein [Paenibacillus sp. P26]